MLHIFLNYILYLPVYLNVKIAILSIVKLKQYERGEKSAVI